MILPDLKDIKSAAMVLCLLPMAVSSDSQIDVLGTATNPKTGEILYYEHHFYPEPGEHKVRYIDKNGESFANKELRYHSGDFRPEVFQQNQWSGEMIRVVYADDEELQLSYKKNEQKPVEQSRIPVTGSLVIDAGFEPFVQHSWTELMANKTLEFNYLAPSKGGVIPLKIEKISSEQSPLIKFQISAKQWLINLILPPIMLTYDEYERLIRFEGTSNIADANGRYLNVDLKFEYLSAFSSSRL